jgi:hypothetical protein
MSPKNLIISLFLFLVFSSEALSQPRFHRHHINLSWSGADMAMLSQISLSHPQNILVRESLVPGTLRIKLTYDVQPPNHEKLKKEFFSDFVSTSERLESRNPHLITPLRVCKEDLDAQGNIIFLAGICVRELTLWIPPSHSLHSIHFKDWLGLARVEGVLLPELRFDLPQNGKVHVSRVSANLFLSEGGPDAQAVISHLFQSRKASGHVDAELKHIKNFLLTHIDGDIMIDLWEKKDAHVSIEGEKVKNFPYKRTSMGSNAPQHPTFP